MNEIIIYSIGVIVFSYLVYLFIVRKYSDLGISSVDIFPNKDRTYRLLILNPHPDDESFLAAGIAARYRKQKNVDISIVSLTRGEKGKLNGKEAPEAEVIAIRTKEFGHAMSVLQPDRFELMTSPDGKIKNLKNLRELVFKILKKYNPTTVVTYEEEGITGHPDHKALTKAILNEYKRSKNFDLYFATLPSSLYKFYEGTSINKSNIAVSIGFSRFAKMRAFIGHKSQWKGLSFKMRLLYILYMPFHNREYFYKVPK